MRVVRRALDSLVEFARIVSDAADSERVFAHLCSALVDHVHADGVAVAGLVSDGRITLVATKGLPSELSALSIEADAIDELGAQILRSVSGSGFASEHARPLVAGGGLYGLVVMLFRDGKEPPPEDIHLAEGLIDLAALALGSTAHVKKLEQQYADLQASQELLARTEKLRALGQMAAGVSHDLRNILNPLSLHLQVVQRALDRGQVETARESIPEMKQVLVRGLQTIERLRDYSRQTKEGKTELVQLNSLAEEAAEIAKARISTKGGARPPRIKDELGDPRAVMAQADEIVNALVNLIVNAIDAFAGAGGTIALRSGEADGGSWVEVADDGPGMPPEIEKRVFEPFFTTKGSEGTGLGLANVYAAMQRLGGKIDLTTTPGKGTCFRLWFPEPGATSVR
jgi:signal transduction histidine kinase